EIALLFTKWIDEETIGNKISKGFRYKFNLLFRGSLDGGSSKKFHVAVIQNSSLLVGGYNPLDWNGDTCKQTINSFLFILDYNDITNAIVSRVNRNNSRLAIGCFNSYGPCFGEGPDLYVPNNSNIWKFKAKTYPKLVDQNSLTISDYEVFQVEQI
ncbi:hypothetical protein C2G38_2235621, partial [Gigaspora rosea]